MDSRKKKVIVLGAGVVGLTTALKIQQTGIYQVEIIAELFPSDPKHIKYCSQWAGARYVSTEEIGTEQAEIDHATFIEMWKMSEPRGIAEHCFLRMTERHYYTEAQKGPSPFERMPEFREIPKQDFPSGISDAVQGMEFKTVTIDVPVYLDWLAQQFQEIGGVMVRKSIRHIDEVVDLRPEALIVCLGMGARFLGGVEDNTVFPSRGQTVILRAPWIRDGGSFINRKANLLTDVIPRRSGDIVIGGTQDYDDWDPEPRRGTTLDLLKRSLEFCPELVPPEKRTKNPPCVEDLLPIVVEEACGLRPFRKGGPRIDLEHKKSIPIIYNYGHGGDGYIKSIGSANIVLQLLAKAIHT